MRAELRDSLEFLFPDSVVSRRPVLAAAVDVARGGTAGVHVLLNDLKKGQAVRVAAHAGRTPARGAEWFRLVDVPVEANTGVAGFVEKAGERNPYVIRRAPFRVYDAMAPIGAAFKATATTEALRLHVPIGASTGAGRRQYTLKVQSGTRSVELSLTVNVHRAVCPAPGPSSLPYTNWFSLDNMARQHGLRTWSEAHWRMIRRYADLMARARQNTFLCSLRPLFSVVGDRPVLDAKRLRRLVGTFSVAGMHFIEGGHVAHRTGGVWGAETFELPLTGRQATSPPGNVDLASICRQLLTEIDRNGWRSRWIQHVADEPRGDNGRDYRILVGMVRKYMPHLPIMDATMDVGLAGSVDIWCPQGQEHWKHRRFFDAYRALGDQVWFYTCCVPGGPCLNRLLDMELLRPVLLGWYAALCDLDGFLHWGLNHGRDPFNHSIVQAGADKFYPAGDSHVVYPGDGGPWSSLRLEAQREGLEDFELLKALRSRNAKAAGTMVRKVIRGFSNYTRNVATFRAVRRALLKRVSS